MRQQGADEVVLETEADNVKSLALYQRMGFWREKRLWRFYLNVRSHAPTPVRLSTHPHDALSSCTYRVWHCCAAIFSESFLTQISPLLA